LDDLQGTLMHIAATYSGSGTNAGLKLYINGTRVDTADAGTGTYTSMTAGTEGVTLGFFDTGNFAAYFTGRLDEVKIYRRELTPEDVNADWAGAVVAAVKRKRAIVY
jgi:hypothetical protein